MPFSINIILAEISINLRYYPDASLTALKQKCNMSHIEMGIEQ